MLTLLLCGHQHAPSSAVTPSYLVLVVVTCMLKDTGAYALLCHAAALYQALPVCAHAQGTIRENLDPMGRHSDRELIGALKATRLWDILCGLSLSQAKARHHSGRGSSHRAAASAARPVPPRASLQSAVGSLPRESPGSSYGATPHLLPRCCRACKMGKLSCPELFLQPSS